MSKTQFYIGDEVVFTASDIHEHLPQYYPPIGTIGVIKEVYKLDNDGLDNDELDTRVQWPEGTTSALDLWYVNHRWIELACPDQGEFEKSDLPISFLLNAELGV